jgi:hypothetical protein
MPKPIDFDALCVNIHALIHGGDAVLPNVVALEDRKTGGEYGCKSA